MSKRQLQHLLWIVLATLLVVPHATAKELPPTLNATVSGNNAFAFDLYAQLKQGQGNLLFSPYSLSSALAMTYAGARGTTAREMAQALHITSEGNAHAAFAQLNTLLEKVQHSDQVQWRAANALWPQQGTPLLPEFLALIRQHYGAALTPLDFAKDTPQAARTINRWVEDKTHNKIQDLVRPSDLDPSTLLVLTNAIYFKGNWARRFDPTFTKQAEFSLPENRKKIRVPMMFQKGLFRYGEHEDIQLLELPYVGDKLAMVIVLPMKTNALSTIEDKLSADNLTTWLSRSYPTDVNVSLPKFTITWGTHELNAALQALGMRSAFGAEADFSAMYGNKDLFLGAVLHKAYAEITEEGTEAAAATAVVTKRGMSAPSIFKADHPFIFLIRDNTTGSILFLGRVLDPTGDKG